MKTMHTPETKTARDLLYAFERGKQDAENHYRLVASGERGKYQKDMYPSNPYNKTGDRLLWESYNSGWNQAF